MVVIGKGVPSSEAIEGEEGGSDAKIEDGPGGLRFNLIVYRGLGIDGYWNFQY